MAAAPAEKPKPAAAAAAGAIPAELTNEDIANPNNSNLLRSVAYCDYQVAQINKTIQESIAKGDRVPADAKALNKLVTQTKGILINGCQTGQISPQEYCDILK